MSRLRQAGAWLAVCALGAAACSDLPTTADARFDPARSAPRNAVFVTTGTVKRVTVELVSGAINKSNWTLAIGAQEQMGATAYDSIGRVITGRGVRFISSNPAWLAIDPATGLATGVADGTVNVSAVIDGVTGKSGNFIVKGIVTQPAPVVRVAVTPAGGALDTTTWTIGTGASTRFAAVAYDSTGAVVTTATPVFSSSDPAVAKVDSVSGSLQALKSGSAVVTAVAGGVRGTTRAVTVTSVGGDTPPVADANSASLSVIRFDGRTGAAKVSNGIPVRPGLLFPGQENRVRVSVGGTEVPAYVVALNSLHTDGSLRAVLVQFQLPSLGATPLAGRVDFSSVRPTSMTLSAPLVTPGSAVTGAAGGLPQAAALPTDANYLVASDFVGVTTTAAANAPLGTLFAKYETDFVKYADIYWSAEGSSWQANYYDRSAIYYAMWARTGNPAYWVRASRHAYTYRVGYLEPNAYGASPQWSLLEGLEKHYLATGDDKSRFAVGRTATRLHSAYINTNYVNRRSGESRITGRMILADILAWRLTPNGTTINGVAQGSYGAQIDAVLGKLVAWQLSNGSFPADAQVCGGQLNYMVGLQNDALTKVHDWYLPNTTTRAAMQTQVRTIVKKAIDYMWSTQWIPASNAFKYASVNCSGIGAPTPAPDLNNIIVEGFGFTWRTSGIASYRTNGDLIYTQGALRSFLQATKQFNEEYIFSYRYLGYR